MDGSGVVVALAIGQSSPRRLWRRLVLYHSLREQSTKKNRCKSRGLVTLSMLFLFCVRVLDSNRDLGYTLFMLDGRAEVGQMAKAQKVVARKYVVVDADTAKGYGAMPFSNGDFNRFALLAMRGEVVDTVVAWGFNRDALDKKAQERNKDIAMLGKMMGKAAADLDSTEEN
jgi:hypothetical protein